MATIVYFFFNLKKSGKNTYVQKSKRKGEHSLKIKAKKGAKRNVLAENEVRRY